MFSWFPRLSSGIKSHLILVLHNKALVLFLFMDMRWFSVYWTSKSNSSCIGFTCRGSLCPVRVWYERGRGTGLSSGTNADLRSTAAQTVTSSTHFTFIFFMGFLLFLGWVICCPIDTTLVGGPAPLNRIKNKLRPSMVPAAVPPGILRLVDVCFLYLIEIFRLER